MFLFLPFLIFPGALGVAGYYVWNVPQQEAQEVLASRLRELRVPSGARARSGQRSGAARTARAVSRSWAISSPGSACCGGCSSISIRPI